MGAFFALWIAFCPFSGLVVNKSALFVPITDRFFKVKLMLVWLVIILPYLLIPLLALT